MSRDDHAAMARDVFDASARMYVESVGTDVNPATECPVDRSLLMAFVEMIGRQAVRRVIDVGCGPGRVAAFMDDHGLDVIGVDVSRSMLGIARAAHPHIGFVEGRMDAIPVGSGVLAGAVCWYSIIYTPPDLLVECFDELARVLTPGGRLLLAFQTEGAPVHRLDAFGTDLPLTSYRHGMHDVVDRLEDAGLMISTTVLRSPELAHEITPQAFVIATRHLT